MITRRTFLASAAALPVAGGLAIPARAAEPAVFQTDGIAINGIDPVAYFTQEKPVEGDPSEAIMFMGATFLFASAENREMFEGNPGKYAPRYGGYCAYAVSKGYTATTDPRAWSVYEGRLYLNYSRPVRALWAVDKDGHIASADANWPGVLG